MLLLPPLLSLHLLTGTAWAYGEKVHHAITRTSLAAAGLDGAAALDPASPAAIRALIDARARNHPDAAIREEWLRRWPTPESFDAWAMKEWLQLSPAATINGIDRNDTPGATALDVAAMAARQPDDDLRNWDRLAYDSARQPLKDKDGNPVPADPIIINMGRLGALSSQAHAHYGLAQVEFSEDSEVLKTDPKRFAVPANWPDGPIITLAAEMNQIHLDLALIAALSDLPDAQTLQWQYAGNSFHYLEDVGNQIHTVQVGLYDFFVDAFKSRLWLSFKTGGGYCGELRSLASIGIDILTNHHTISEMLTQERLMESVEGKGGPVGDRLTAAMKTDDPEFSATLDKALSALGGAPEAGEFGVAITRALIATSAEEGDDVYRATRAIALPAWRKEGVIYDYAKEDPDNAVAAPTDKNAADYEAFWGLQEKAFRRVGTALRREVALQRAFAAAAAPEERAARLNSVMDRLIKRQLQMLTEGGQRREQYLKTHTAVSKPPERMPAMLAGQIGVPGLGLAGLYWWTRKKA